MKYLLILIALLPALTVSGQENSESAKSKKAVFIGFNFSPDYNYRTLSHSDENEIYAFIVETRDEMEIPKFGFTTGLNAGINLTDKVGLETGLQYALKGYNTKYSDLRFVPYDPAAPKRSKFIYDMHFLDIPLKANVTLGNGKLRYMGAAGIVTNIFLRETQTSIRQFENGDEIKNTTTTPFDYMKVNFSLMVSSGITYAVKENIQLRIEPTFRHGVLEIIKSPVTAHLWNAGLNLGLYYKL